MNPLLRNTILLFIVFFYIYAIVALAAKIKERIDPMYARKFIHVAVSTRILFRPLVKDPTGREIATFGLLLYATISLLDALGVIKLETFEEGLKRYGSRTELAFGPVTYPLAQAIFVRFFRHHPLSGVAIGIMGLGDGMAAILGYRKPIKSRKIMGSSRSLAGFIAFIIFGTLGGRLYGYYLYVTGFTSSMISLKEIFLMSLAAALVEAIVPGELDNIPIALAILLVRYF